jgi:predicted DNA-binding protein
MKFKKTLIPERRIAKANKNITFNVDLELVEEFKTLCKKKRIAQSDIISIAIKQAIEEMKHV